MYIYSWQAGFSAARGDDLLIRQLPACITDGNSFSSLNLILFQTYGR
jgi:hypothetical protein